MIKVKNDKLASNTTKEIIAAPMNITPSDPLFG